MQADVASGGRRLEEARAGFERDLTAALADVRARCEADLRACAVEAAQAKAQAREEAAAAAAERERQDGERARAASLERLEWMKERQQGEEGAWVGVFFGGIVVLSCCRAFEGIARAVMSVVLIV